MINAQLNYFDMAVLSVMFLSCLFAFFRGFVKEILSLIAWVGAAFITVRYFPQVAEKLQPHFAKPLMAAIVATLSLYFGSLIVFAIINRIIIKILKSGEEIGWFDNMLGLAFGALRGAFIVSLAYLMVTEVIKDESQPLWLVKATTRPYVEKGANMLRSIAPQYTEELSNLQKKTKERAQESGTEATESVSTPTLNKIEDTGKDSGGSFEQMLKDMGKKQ